MMVTVIILPERDFGRMFFNSVPVDSLLTKFSREELIEKNDETLADITVVEIFVAVQSLWLIFLIRTPIPLRRTGKIVLLQERAKSVYEPLNLNESRWQCIPVVIASLTLKLVMILLSVAVMRRIYIKMIWSLQLSLYL